MLQAEQRLFTSSKKEAFNSNSADFAILRWFLKYTHVDTDKLGPRYVSKCKTLELVELDDVLVAAERRGLNTRQ